MPAFQRRRNADGSVPTTAILRVRGFQATSKTFKASTAREADSLAKALATDQESSLYRHSASLRSAERRGRGSCGCSSR